MRGNWTGNATGQGRARDGETISPKRLSEQVIGTSDTPERRVPPFDLKIVEFPVVCCWPRAGSPGRHRGRDVRAEASLTLCRSGRVALDLRLADYVDSTGVRSRAWAPETVPGPGGASCELVIRAGSGLDRTLALVQLADRSPVYGHTSDAGCGALALNEGKAGVTPAFPRSAPPLQRRDEALNALHVHRVMSAPTCISLRTRS